MKQYLKHDPWQIIEEGFNPHVNKVSESIFSIGNGHMGQRGNFEEAYSGESLQGTYVAGVYYPDKTRVGWWKNGYPEYFAKVLNAPRWIGIGVNIEKHELDLATARVESFYRILDMRTGLLTRQFVVMLPDGKKLEVESKRFCSMAQGEVGAISYTLRAVNFSGVAQLTLDVDADVINQDSNYQEKFWDEVSKDSYHQRVIVTAQTKKTQFQVATGMSYRVQSGGKPIEPRNMQVIQREKYAAHVFEVELQQDKAVTIYKYAAVLSSLNHPQEKLTERCQAILDGALQAGFDDLFQAHAHTWQRKWEECDITIEGDVAAQQGIRFNIFQLTQTYTGNDERLNIGPKGFTGEKYGGSTYWDTEAYCIPFFLGTAPPRVARNLLIYRYKHLARAIENAGKLGFTGGAALYPMVTMNGEECHNEWEITFEEIHRNGAIAYAIYDYVRYTGDEGYLADYGLEVLIGIARFWSQRINWSEDKKKYVMLGVTGPNEYENNVNNNWYTNYIAVWTLRYTIEVLNHVKVTAADKWKALQNKVAFSETAEPARWNDIVANMYFPYDKTREIFLQQDGFLDKELIPVSALAEQDRPLNQKWSWDRILRSCFIKQADVLQGLYFFEEQFTLEEIKRNFDFYEPMTVHESSLSPCVHSILASRLGYYDKAYEMYLRTSRLDLDDYNNDTEDGCHITSMAGTWMSIVKGFGGMRVQDGNLHLKPFLPQQWKSYSFRLEFQNRIIKVTITKAGTDVKLIAGNDLSIIVNGIERKLMLN
ncbi:MAG: glycoside hydrolase family 65 protein [Flammeovirgaceae bacterium]|nr:MAG: glycoside hydrolase family 65 protein [Flammeovirgaceae bacterium]